MSMYSKVLTATALALVMTCQQEPPAQNTPGAQRIWDAVLTAKGGSARLKSVTILVTSSVRRATRRPAGAFEDAIVDTVLGLPDRFWMWEDYRPESIGFSVQVFNPHDRLYWIADNGGEPRSIDLTKAIERGRASLLEEKQLVYLLESTFVQPADLRLVDSGSDDAHLCIEARSRHFARIRYTIDRAASEVTTISLWPLVEMEGREPFEASSSVDYEFYGHQVVDGIQFPEGVRGLGDLTFVVNPKIDPQLFRTPPDNVTRRDEWRRWVR